MSVIGIVSCELQGCKSRGGASPIQTLRRADAGWEYVGRTKPEVKYVKRGRMLAKRTGKVSRTRAEMEALGCERLPASSKHKFVHISRRVLSHPSEESR